MNKSEKVREHLRRYKSITSWKAIEKYNETRLSSVIFNCREDGWDIESEWHYKYDKDHDLEKYVKYKLISLPEE